jgi:DNA adenine methylase
MAITLLRFRTGLQSILPDSMTASTANNGNTAFGYFGSKKRLAVELCSKLPPHHAWVEMFCGSAALTFAKAPAQIEVINDVDNEIVNFFEQLRNHEKELCRLVALTPYAREELKRARHPPANIGDLERARHFLVCSMMAVNGVFGAERGGFSYSDSYTRDGREARVNRWYNVPERIAQVAERLRGVRVENKDAKELFQQFLRRPATLIYLDPPYLGERTNGYTHDANDPAFHRELLKLANRAKCMVFISGYSNELYSQFLTREKGWQLRTIEATTRDSSGQDHKRTEVVWMNKYFRNAQQTNEIPISLTKKESKQKKVNPSRARFESTGTSRV